MEWIWTLSTAYLWVKMCSGFFKYASVDPDRYSDGNGVTSRLEKND
ncbi:MAG: hypothetical protein IPJ13_01105 [Saprospiraceae bacterium]|nr:hypothetical protein [Saprospiraceae bacterium]